MCPENLSVVIHPELEISKGNRVSVSQWINEQTYRHTKNLRFEKLLYKHLQNISRKFEKDSSSRTGYITDNLFSVKKWDNEQTDRQTINLKLFKISMQTSQECL